jgi:hypothetical protein
MSTILGKTSSTLNSEEVSFTPQAGYSGRWAIEGPKESVRPLITRLAALGYSFTYLCDQSPKASIRYETNGRPEPGGSGVETPSLVWEYLANVAEIDVLEADIAGINGISAENRRVIRDAIALPDPDNAPDFDPTDPNILSAQDIYDLMLKGVRSFRVNVPTLKRSALVSGSYGVQASLSNVGSIITPATLTIQENIPGTILFSLPTFSSTKAGFVYAWYKKHPQVQQAGGNKWSVSQEWEYGLWPTLLYGTAL